MIELLIDESKKIGISLTDSQIEQFEIYMNFLLEYNEHTNLTAITDPEDIMIKHFLDSIILSKFIDIPQNAKLVDVGTGAGFPGVPLKIANEGINLTLIDSLNKRIVFLNELMNKLNVSANIFHGRAEELSHNSKFRERFDIAVSRAVAPLSILCEYCLPYTKVGGYLVALKGANFQEEVDKSRDAVKILGGKIEKIETFNLPKNKGLRSVVIIKKTSNTNKKYPRSNSQISKKPL